MHREHSLALHENQTSDIMKALNYIFAFVLTLVLTQPTLGAIKTTIADGSWDDPAIWSPTGAPLLEDTIIIDNEVTCFNLWVEFGANLFWVKSGSSVTGDSIFALHGSFLIDGTVDVETFAAGDGTNDVNNGNIIAERFIHGNVHFTNIGTLSGDSLVIGDANFVNTGAVEANFLVCPPSPSFTYNHGIIAVMDAMHIVGKFTNHSTAFVSVGSLNTTLDGDTLFNDGEITAISWNHNLGTAAGTGGKYCVELCFNNLDAIIGTIDVCDDTPGGTWPCDINMGTIASTVTLCTASPCASVGVEDEYFTIPLELSVFPNPMSGSGKIRITGLNGQTFHYSIYDLSGQLVDQQSNVAKNEFEINVANYQSGMYWCSVRTVNGNSQIKFIVH